MLAPNSAAKPAARDWAMVRERKKVMSGPGVSPAQREVIFEKFRQGGDPLSGKPEGSGLGLYISRRIVEHWGGRLWVSGEPGEGACFSFTLPLAGEASLGKAA